MTLSECRPGPGSQLVSLAPIQPVKLSNAYGKRHKHCSDKPLRTVGTRGFSMRRGIIVGPSLMAATFIAISSMSASGAHWCGFSARPHAIIQCGYSSREICQSAIGKDAKCFVDPYVALNGRRTILARVVTHHLQPEFGQPVVVEN